MSMSIEGKVVLVTGSATLSARQWSWDLRATE